MDSAIEAIRRCIAHGSVFYTSHSRREMAVEETGRILEQDVVESIRHGEIIEEYPTTRPYPSYLIYGKIESGRVLHVVCALNSIEDTVIIITVYEPTPTLWTDFRTRKRQ